MTYGLPAHGELNWDTKLGDSIAAVKVTADAAETTTGSQTKADAAAAAAATDATTKANAVQANLNTHTGNVSNPHSTTRAQVGLSNVDNTSDANKPVSTAQQTALDLKVDKSKSLSQQTASYTLVLADAGKWVEVSNASANTLTVPPNSSVAFPVGTQIEGMQTGAGQTTITAGAGVTINADPGLKVATQYGSFGLIKVATDVWRAYGRLSA